MLLLLGYNPRLGDNPRYLKTDSLFTVARRQAPDLVTASITSKEYLVNASMHDRDGDGEPDATYVYEPRLYIPVSEHETDYLVMEEVLGVSRELDPHFCFVNLGDVDRVGHVDATGGVTSGQAPVWRTQTLTATDTLVGALVRQLENDDKWGSTVLIVTADHNMDWSFPDRIVNLYPEFQDDDLLRDEVVLGLNGGAAMYALRYPLEPRAPERLKRCARSLYPPTASATRCTPPPTPSTAVRSTGSGGSTRSGVSLATSPATSS